MIKTVLVRTIAHTAVAAVCALLGACTSYSAPAPAVQTLPPGPTPEEMASYATAQMQYRSGLSTGNGDVVAKANETFRQIPREIFSRQDPKLFGAEVLCERYRVARPAATDRTHTYRAEMPKHRMALQRSNERYPAGLGDADRRCRFRDNRTSGRGTPLRDRSAVDGAHVRRERQCDDGA